MLIMHIGFFACFSRHISQTQSFQQNCHIVFHALVALKLLVSLISRLVACNPRIVIDTHTDRQTDTQTKYCNPRCACAPRVNYAIHAFNAKHNAGQIPMHSHIVYPCSVCVWHKGLGFLGRERRVLERRGHKPLITRGSWGRPSVWCWAGRVVYTLYIYTHNLHVHVHVYYHMQCTK